VIGVAEIRQLASELTNRARFAAIAGLTFNGNRNLYEALGYDRELTIVKYRARYKRNSIAARVVESMPRATWRGGAELIENEDPQTSTEFEEAWQELEDRLHVWSVFGRADVLAGLGEYAIILIGATGAFDTPLPAMSGTEGIYYLTPFGQDDALIDTYVTDITNPRFGQPEYYQVKRIGNIKSSTSLKVHWSRVIHVADNVLDDQIHGTPRLERVWNLLDDLDKVTGAGAEAFWIRAHQGYHFDLDKDLQIDPAEATKMKESAEELAHGLRRTIATKGMKVQTFGSDVANFGPQVDAIITLIAGGTGIPKRILVGSERGELSSLQDKENWERRVSDRRMEFAEPFVVRPFVQRITEQGALPEVENYDIRWPEIEDLNETEKAQVASAWAGLNTAAGEVVVTGAEIRDLVLGLEKLEEGDINPMHMPDPVADEPLPGKEDEEDKGSQPPGAKEDDNADPPEEK
jgi:hypothetical protein